MSDNNHKCCSTHCCDLHGCKYGYDDCPVVMKVEKQKFICETCYELGHVYEHESKQFFYDKNLVLHEIITATTIK